MKILVGGWFTLPRVGADVFSALMKQGVVYDKKFGFKLDSATDMELAVRTISSALGAEVELAVRCFICVPGGTLILGDNKAIRDYKPGEQSVGVLGLGNIKETLSRDYEGWLVRVRATGMLPLELTPEHPVLVSRSTTRRHRTGKNRVQTRTFSKLHWKEAEAVTCKTNGVDGDYLFIPRIPGSITDDRLSLRDFTSANGRRVCAAKDVRLQIPLNQDTAWLLGMYIAEGFPSSTCACFSLSHDETEIHQKIIEIGKSIGYSPKKYRLRTSTVVVIPSRVLSRALTAWCGKGARQKKVPDFVLYHKDPAIVKALLDGYVMGDGYTSGGLSFMSTTSRVLALQIQLLAARLGSFVSIRRTRSGSSVIDGRAITGGPDGKYQLELRPRGNQSFARVTSLGILTPIRSVESVPFKGPVYNLETEDNTYLVSNVVVHNCGSESCPGCPYIEVCDRRKVSPLCLCGKHAPEKGVYELYQKTFEESAGA
jgi:hypothetical protein